MYIYIYIYKEKYFKQESQTFSLYTKTMKIIIRFHPYHHCYHYTKRTERYRLSTRNPFPFLIIFQSLQPTAGRVAIVLHSYISYKTVTK